MKKSFKIGILLTGLVFMLSALTLSLISLLSTPDSLINNKEISSSTSDSIQPESTHGTTDSHIESSNLGDFTMNQYFNAADINSETEKRILGKSYKENDNIALSDLQYLTVLYYGFDELPHVGELIVHRKIADKVLTIFKELYEAKYPIEKITLIDEYEADDIASMADNNSSAFCYRTIDSSTKMSKHSLGIAIDINPLYNPYVRTRNGKQEVLPAEGAPYVDRSMLKPYMMDSEDLCVKTFKKYGFTWGGDWKNSKDYQHFEIELED